MFSYCDPDRAPVEYYASHSLGRRPHFRVDHDDRPLRVAVLAGGESREREVSLASGEQVLAALRSAGYAAELFDPAATPLSELGGQRFDVAFIALHGGAGEDGRVQAQLRLLGIPYTGSGPSASRLAMYKATAKERFLEHDIATPPFVLLEFGDQRHTQAARCQQLGYPLVVKPDSQGSSLGVSRVASPEELDAALEAAAKLDAFVLVERCIEGREFTLALLGRQPLPLLEIVVDDPIFSYDSKYSSPATRLVFDHGLAQREAAALVDAASAAAAAIGVKGLSRVDLMLDRAGQPWVLEVNTVPGLTARSLAPRAAAEAGYDLPRLCEWMLRDALEVEALR